MHDTGEVDQLESQIDARVDGLSQPMLACTKLTAADTAAWKAFYLSWKTLSLYWRNLRSTNSTINAVQGIFDAEGIIGTSIYDQMYPYSTQLDTWATRLNTACPGTYAPPPGITLPKSAPPTDWAGITQMVLTGAIAVSAAVVLYKGLVIVEDLTSHARKA